MIKQADLNKASDMVAHLVELRRVRDLVTQRAHAGLDVRVSFTDANWRHTSERWSPELWAAVEAAIGEEIEDVEAALLGMDVDLSPEASVAGVVSPNRT